MIILLLALLAAPFFIALDDSSVWDANEAFYVQTPREMLQRGDWIVPHFNGVPRLNKPPLSYWVVGFFYRVFGVSLFWERLVLALWGFGSVLVLLQISRFFMPLRDALFTAAVFGTTFRLHILARRLLIDTLMLFWVLVFVWLLVGWLKNGGRWRILAAGAALGLAFLAKGPVALLPVLLILTAALIGRLRVPVLSCWPGVLAFGLVSTSWFVALGLRVGIQPVLDFFFQENLGRYGYVTFGPARGPLYYLQIFVSDFFPWSLLTLALIPWTVALWRNRGSRHIDPAITAGWVWLLGYVGFFSLSLNKQEYYIVPAYAAAAFLLGLYSASQRSFPKWATWPAAFLLLVAAILLTVIVRMITPELAWSWLPAAALVTASIVFFLRMPLASSACLSAFYLLAFAVYLPAFERFKPVETLAEAIKTDADLKGLRGNFTAGYLRYTAPSLTFYLNQPILELYDVQVAAKHLRSDEPVYMIMGADDHARLSAELGDRLQIVASKPKLYTTARAFIEGFKSGPNRRTPDPWTRPVLLVSNQGTAARPD